MVLTQYSGSTELNRSSPWSKGTLEAWKRIDDARKVRDAELAQAEYEAQKAKQHQFTYLKKGSASPWQAGQGK
jgi:hypothetical protein